MPPRVLYLIQSEHHHFGLAPVIIHTHRLISQLDARTILIRMLGSSGRGGRVGYFHDSMVERDLPRLHNLLKYAMDVGELSEDELPDVADQFRGSDNYAEAYRKLALQRYLTGNYPDYDLIKTIGVLASLKSEGVEVILKPTEKHHAVYGQADLRRFLPPGAMKRVRKLPTKTERATALFREIIDIRSTFIIENINEYAEDCNIAFLGIDHVLTDLESIPNLKVYRVLIELGSDGGTIVLNGELPDRFMNKIPAVTEGRIPIDDAIMYSPE